MTTQAEFLDAVLPSKDCDFAVVHCAKGASPSNHIWVTDHQALIAQTNSRSAKSETYFTYTGYTKGTTRRRGVNATKVKTFVLDVDIDPNLPTEKAYHTIAEAEQGVRDISKKIGLPEPTYVVATGGGFHVYWALEAPMDAIRWKSAALNLKKIIKSVDTRIALDLTRVADTAGILRLPETRSHKRSFDVHIRDDMSTGVLIPNHKLPSSIASQGVVALPSAGAVGGTPAALSSAAGGPSHTALIDPDAFTSMVHDDDLPAVGDVSVKALMQHCAAAREGFKNQDADYEGWRQWLRTMVRAKESFEIQATGVNLIHTVASRSARYEYNACETAIQKEITNMETCPGIACDTYATAITGSREVCQGCTFYKPDGGSPLVAGAPSTLYVTHESPASPPSMDVDVPAHQDVGQFLIPPMIQDPASAYGMSATGNLIKKARVANGTFKGSPEIKIADHVWWYGRHWVAGANQSDNNYEVEIRYYDKLRNRGGMFYVDASVRGSTAALRTALAGQGCALNPSKNATEPIADYMMNYAGNPNLFEPGLLTEQFGWTTDPATGRKSFVIGKERYIAPTTAGGVVGIDDVRLGPSAAAAFGRYNLVASKKGTAAGYKAIMGEYDKYATPEAKFAVLMGFAAPLVEMLEVSERGCVVHLFGETSLGKSEILRFISGIWGKPTVNYMHDDDTKIGAIQSVLALQNLPVAYDEITSIESEKLMNFLYSFSSGRAHNAATKRGTLRESIGEWATILISTGNISIPDTIYAMAMKRQATLNRMLEVDLTTKSLHIHDKSPAQAELHMKNMASDVGTNSGTLGPEFITAILANYDAVKALLDATFQKWVLKTSAASEERYRLLPFVCGEVALKILQDYLGMTFKSDWMKDSASLVQQAMTQKDIDTAVTAKEFLGAVFSDFYVDRSAITVDNFVNRKPTGTQFEPNRAALYRADVCAANPNEVLMCIPHATLRDQCKERSAELRSVINGAKAEGLLVTAPRGREHRKGDSTSWSDTLYKNAPKQRCYVFKLPV